MKKLLQFTTEDGDVFFVEADEPVAAPAMRGSGGDEASRGVVQTVSESFEKALKPLKDVSNTIISSIKDVVNSPNEVQVEMGLKFSAKAGIILTSLDSEANLKIVLKWTKKAE